MWQWTPPLPALPDMINESGRCCGSRDSCRAFQLALTRHNCAFTSSYTSSLNPKEQCFGLMLHVNIVSRICKTVWSFRFGNRSLMPCIDLLLFQHLLTQMSAKAAGSDHYLKPGQVFSLCVLPWKQKISELKNTTEKPKAFRGLCPSAVVTGTSGG